MGARIDGVFGVWVSGILENRKMDLGTGKWILRKRRWIQEEG